MEPGARRLRHGDANVDVRAWTTARRHAEAETGAVNDARGHRHGEPPQVQRVAGSLARLTAFAPHFPAPAAPAAGGSHGEIEGHGRSAAGLLPRQADFGPQPIDEHVGLDEGVAHPLDLVAERRKIDRHFVGKRSIEVTIERRRPIDRDSRIIHAPLMFHGALEVA